MEDKIFNNSYDSVEYGRERTTNASISISPLIEDRYKENTSENMEEVYDMNELMEFINEEYKKSEFYEKYKQDPKDIDRCDVLNIYYYFKDKIKAQGRYDVIQTFCAIAEVFNFKYNTLYNNMITLEEKAEILEAFEQNMGMKKRFLRAKKLF